MCDAVNRDKLATKSSPVLWIQYKLISELNKFIQALELKVAVLKIGVFVVQGWFGSGCTGCVSIHLSIRLVLNRVHFLIK